jgi:hypothetical protein
LFRLRRRTLKQPDDSTATQLDFSVPLSSGTLWRDLFRPSRRRGRRPVAIVFELPAECWPIDLFLEVSPAIADSLLKGLRGRRSGELAISHEAFQFVSQAASRGFWSDLEARANTSRAVGILLRSFLSTGAAAWSRYDETVEVVIRRSVPPAAICKLVPLSQTNLAAKAKRTKAQRSDFADD